MGQLKVEVTQSDLAPEVTILRFEGDLDTGSIRSIADSFERIIEKHTSYVVADMGAVNMLSSAALGELMGGRKSLAEKGGDLLLACLSLSIKTKLTLLGATKIFKLFSDIRSAIGDYKWEFEGKSEAFSLSFPANLKFVPSVRQFASRLVSQKGYSRRDAFRIETIVDEICNNAVEHAPKGWSKNVSLTLNIDRRKIEVNVINASDPEKLKALKGLFEPGKAKEQASTATADERRGRGLALVKLLSSELDIDVSERGTCVHATKLKEE
jgi:anti-anti-sigma factor